MEACTKKKVAFLSVNITGFYPIYPLTMNEPECSVLQIPEVIYYTSVGMPTSFASSLTQVFRHKYVKFPERNPICTPVSNRHQIDVRCQRDVLNLSQFDIEMWI